MPGMLSVVEVDCLFQMAQINHCEGVIVEIGSWKGKSTIALARGAAKAHREKIYAIDPHSIQPEAGYLEDTRTEFLENLKQAGVDGQVVPMIMTSEIAAKAWDKPIRLLWIDGDHRYDRASLDFKLWEPFVAEGGIIALHDTIRKTGPKRVLWENVFRSKRFQQITICDNITAAKKVRRASWLARLRTYLTLALRGIYIAARKSRVPYSKPAGRWLLRKLTAQSWMPITAFFFSSSMAR